MYDRAYQANVISVNRPVIHCLVQHKQCSYILVYVSERTNNSHVHMLGLALLL